MNDCYKKTDERIRRPNRGSLLKMAARVLMGVGLVLSASLMGGCSSPPEGGPDPSKQEIQSDADRFFNKMEKEEAKKEAKEAKP